MLRNRELLCTIRTIFSSPWKQSQIADMPVRNAALIQLGWFNNRNFTASC